MIQRKSDVKQYGRGIESVYHRNQKIKFLVLSRSSTKSSYRSFSQKSGKDVDTEV